MSKIPTKLTPEEIKLRGSLLAKNKELLKLHKELVFTSILSEEEFWEDRRGLLRGQEMILKQKKGLTSSLVEDDLKPVTGASSDVKYILTPTIIQSIFEQHPILKKAFNDLVNNTETDEAATSKLTERDFWLEYFKSKFFNESHQKTGSTILDPYFQETCINEASSSNQQNVKISGQCDISRSEDDHVSDYVRYEREAAANGSAWNSLRQFNKHSLRVLQALKSDDSNELKFEEKNSFDYIEIPDLQQAQTPAMATLNLQESQLFSGNSSTNKGSASETVNVQGIIKSFDKFKFDPSVYQLDYSKNKELVNKILKTNNFVPSENSSLDPNVNNNPNPLSDEQLQLINSSTELLRHFWKSASNPTKMTPERSAKLTRLISVLEKMEERIANHSHLINLKDVICKAKLKYSELVK